MIHPTEKGYGFVDTATGAETVIDLGLQSAPFGGNYLFSPDGRLFCAPVDNKGLRLYELPSGKHLGDIANPGDEQHAAAFTPDGKHLLLWTHHKEVWALDSWDIAAQKRRSILSGASLPGRLHFAPDGTRFALVPGSIGSYRPAGDWEIRDFATGQELGRVPTTDYASRVLFSPDGRTLYTQPGYMVVPWDIPTGKPAAAAPAILGPIDRFRFTPDGKVVGLAGGFVYTWDPLTAKELSRARVPRPIDWYGAVSFNPTADRLHFTAVGDTLDVWDFHRGDVHESPLDLQRFPNSAVEHWFTPDGRGTLSIATAMHSCSFATRQPGRKPAASASRWNGASLAGMAASMGSRYRRTAAGSRLGVTCPTIRGTRSPGRIRGDSECERLRESRSLRDSGAGVCRGILAGWAVRGCTAARQESA